MDLGSVFAPRGLNKPARPDPWSYCKCKSYVAGVIGPGISQRAAAARTQRLWRWLVVTGRKQQAASSKLLTNKEYRIIKDYGYKDSITNYRRQPVEAFKDAWLVDRFSGQRVQDRGQAPENTGQRLS